MLWGLVDVLAIIAAVAVVLFLAPAVLVPKAAKRFLDRFNQSNASPRRDSSSDA